MTKLSSTFNPLSKLVGTWKMNGRTLDSDEDNIFGETTIQPILGGKYLEQRGHMTFKSKKANLDFGALEILYYDAERNVFPAMAYSSIGKGAGDTPVLYEWYVEKDGTVVHKGAGAIYHGMFSEDGNMLKGGWRPDNSEDGRDEASYDVSMTRL